MEHLKESFIWLDINLFDSQCKELYLGYIPSNFKCAKFQYSYNCYRML